MWGIFSRLGFESDLPCHIWSDSLNAVDVLNDASNNKGHSDIARLAYTALKEARSRCEIHIHHVKGHDDHPWNTLADNIARATMKGTLESAPLPQSSLRMTDFTRAV